MKNIVLISALLAAATALAANSEAYNAAYEKQYKESYAKYTGATPATEKQTSLYVGAAANYGNLSVGSESNAVYGGEVQAGVDFGHSKYGHHRVKLIGNFLTTGDVDSTEGLSKLTERVDGLMGRFGYSYEFKIENYSSFYIGLNGGAIRVNDSVSGTTPVYGVRNYAFAGSASDTTYIIGAEIGFNIAVSKNWVVNIGVEANRVGATTFEYNLGRLGKVTAENEAATLYLAKLGVQWKF